MTLLLGNTLNQTVDSISYGHTVINAVPLKQLSFHSSLAGFSHRTMIMVHDSSLESF